MTGRIGEFADVVAARTGKEFADYTALWQWSVEYPAQFWRAVWEFFDLGPLGSSDDSAVLADPTMPAARWFPDVTLNYVDQVLRHRDQSGAAIVALDEEGRRVVVEWTELPGRIADVMTRLQDAGVTRGDVVAAYLPDTAEAVVAFLATAALGATWSSCGQDYAPSGAAGRLAQLRPVVLVSGDGYRHGGKVIDKTADTRELLEMLPGATLLRTEDFTTGQPGAQVVTEQVPADHPLWVLFSSGTTGRPKGLVQGHGGILVEHLKAAALHGDLGPGDVFFWQTALSWMMWNYQLAGLLCGSTIVCYSGSPLFPTADRLWQVLADERVTYFGTSPGQLQASRKAGLHPGADHDLSALRTLGSTGSSLAPDLFDWVDAEVAAGLPVSSISGGTDVCTAFAGGSTGVTVVPGELSVRYLAVAVHSWSSERRPLIDEVGEMVITAPMPSMPVRFWDDPDGDRYRAAYFSHEWADGPDPHIWRHGDWVTVTDRGSLIIHGRSDATLNRHGIRMGSADIYEVVESVDEVAEAFVLGVDLPDGRYWMPLFVTLVAGATFDDSLVAHLRTAIRNRLSPRHVPDEVILAPGVPHTRTGKKLEVPVTAILAGRPDVSVDLKSVDDPELIDWYRGQHPPER
ncbi:acetoacetate--CoA ligase [Williamsia sterculiae]|uniref:acetoacetate--CoA ligase n=1 Tax=Williamsia sterculiae TaxID=1344003 RepID=UPI0009708872